MMLPLRKQHALAWSLVIGQAFKKHRVGTIEKATWEKLIKLIPDVEDECRKCDGCKIVEWLRPQFPMVQDDDKHTLACVKIKIVMDLHPKTLCGTFMRAVDSAGFGAYTMSNENAQRVAVQCAFRMGMRRGDMAARGVGCHVCGWEITFGDERTIVMGDDAKGICDECISAATEQGESSPRSN